jgi:rhodanese-related sulfurtransferase
MANNPVTQVPAADPKAAEAHFAARLAFETDPADVHAAMAEQLSGFVLVDARSRDAFAKAHLPGALSLPHREMTEATTASLPRDAVIVTYCWSASCNASTKGARRLAALGFKVKEMIGGLLAWEREGYPVERG